jgi:hypothetical protein
MEAKMDISKEELCEKIRNIYPDIGSCGIDIETKWDSETESWIVDLEKDGKQLTTHLEPKDAENCIEGQECVHLGMQIAQLKGNL